MNLLGRSKRSRWSTKALVPAALALCALPLSVGGASSQAGDVSASAITPFQNMTGISIPELGRARPYPSEIVVQGLPALVQDVDLVLYGFEHARPDDVDILLQGPTGQTAVVLSDVGGTNPVGGINLVLNDETTRELPDNGQIQQDTYRPRNVDAPDNFPLVSEGDGGSSLGVFDRTAANGTWRLYVKDDEGTRRGSIAGWELRILTYAAPQANDDRYRVRAGEELDVTRPGVLRNDSDPDGDPLSVRLITRPREGTLRLRGDGSFTYRAPEEGKGTESFIYEIRDTTGQIDRARVTIKVGKSRR